MSKILVCTDGSLYAPSIYQYAAWAAEKLRAEVQLLHVIERNDAPVAHDFSGNLGFHANEELMGELIRLDETHARVARLPKAAAGPRALPVPRARRVVMGCRS